MKLINFLPFFLVLLLIACSSSQETTKSQDQQSEDEIYVFDDVDVVDDSQQEVEEELPVKEEPSQPVKEIFENEVVEESETLKSLKHIVQVGAYKTRANAEKFIYDNSSKIGYSMEVSYNENISLYVIWLPPFNTRLEAENVRDELWKISKFADAFILTIEK